MAHSNWLDVDLALTRYDAGELAKTRIEPATDVFERANLVSAVAAYDRQRRAKGPMSDADAERLFKEVFKAYPGLEKVRLPLSSFPIWNDLLALYRSGQYARLEAFDYRRDVPAREVPNEAWTALSQMHEHAQKDPVYAQLLSKLREDPLTMQMFLGVAKNVGESPRGVVRNGRSMKALVADLQALLAANEAQARQRGDFVRRPDQMAMADELRLLPRRRVAQAEQRLVSMDLFGATLDAWWKWPSKRAQRVTIAAAEKVDPPVEQADPDIQRVVLPVDSSRVQVRAILAHPDMQRVILQRRWLTANPRSAIDLFDTWQDNKNWRRTRLFSLWLTPYNALVVGEGSGATTRPATDRDLTRLKLVGKRQVQKMINARLVLSAPKLAPVADVRREIDSYVEQRGLTVSYQDQL